DMSVSVSACTRPPSATLFPYTTLFRSQDEDGNSLLMLAAYHGHSATVTALIEQGADVDLRNGRNQSPVAGALFKGEDDVVAVLVEAGADLDGGEPSARATAQMFGRQELLPNGGLSRGPTTSRCRNRTRNGPVRFVDHTGPFLGARGRVPD